MIYTNFLNNYQIIIAKTLLDLLSCIVTICISLIELLQ